MKRTRSPKGQTLLVLGITAVAVLVSASLAVQPPWSELGIWQTAIILAKKTFGFGEIPPKNLKHKSVGVGNVTFEREIFGLTASDTDDGSSESSTLGSNSWNQSRGLMSQTQGSSAGIQSASRPVMSQTPRPTLRQPVCR